MAACPFLRPRDVQDRADGVGNEADRQREEGDAPRQGTRRLDAVLGKRLGGRQPQPEHGHETAAEDKQGGYQGGGEVGEALGHDLPETSGHVELSAASGVLGKGGIPVECGEHEGRQQQEDERLDAKQDGGTAHQLADGPVAEDRAQHEQAQDCVGRQDVAEEEKGAVDDADQEQPEQTPQVGGAKGPARGLGVDAPSEQEREDQDELAGEQPHDHGIGGAAGRA